MLQQSSSEQLEEHQKQPLASTFYHAVLTFYLLQYQILKKEGLAQIISNKALCTSSQFSRLSIYWQNRLNFHSNSLLYNWVSEEFHYYWSSFWTISRFQSLHTTIIRSIQTCHICHQDRAGLSLTKCWSLTSNRWSVKDLVLYECAESRI